MMDKFKVHGNFAIYSRSKLPIETRFNFQERNAKSIVSRHFGFVVRVVILGFHSVIIQLMCSAIVGCYLDMCFEVSSLQRVALLSAQLIHESYLHADSVLFLRIVHYASNFDFLVPQTKNITATHFKMLKTNRYKLVI